MGIMNRGVVYGLWDYNGENPDELSFREGDCMTIIRREDEDEIEWWWARMADTEGYIPRNLLGVSHWHCDDDKSLCRSIYAQTFIVDMSSCCLLTALPQNKAKTEIPGLKHKDPCTFQSARTPQNTHTHTNTHRL